MFIDLRGYTAHVRLDGLPGRPALLMLHSLGTTGAVWEEQAAALATRYRVVRPDLRGHGLSGVPDGGTSIEQMADEALAVLDALGVRQAHVAGLSIGGLVAQAVALAAPDRVMSLTLCDTASVIPPAQMWRDRAAVVRREGVGVIAEGVLERWLTPAGRNAPGARGLRQMLLRTDPQGYAAAAEAIGEFDATARTGELVMPALVLVGEQDEATPVRAAEALHHGIAGSELVVLEGASHIPTIERPEAVTQAIGGFLSRAGVQADAADLHEAGMRTRRAVLGSAHVDRALANTTPFDAAFQRFITRTAWGGVWERGHFDHRTRSLLTLVLLAGLGREEEYRLHIRASRNTGASSEDIAEAMLHVAVYAGIPAANSAMRIAKEMFKEMGVTP